MDAWKTVNNSRAKSKNAGQRSKDHSKHQQQQQQQNNNAVQSAANNNQQQKQQNVVVPPPQPAKAHNKTSKKSDINQRGANKEGTDMDAFNDNSAAAAVTAANVNNVSGSGDVKLNVKQQQQQQRDLDNVQITNVVAAKNNNNLNNSSSGAVVVNNHDLLNANSLPATTTTTTVNAKNDATETTTVAPSSAELINDVANKNTTPAATIAVAKPASINDVITSTTTTPPPSTAPTATPLPPSRREVTPPPAPQTTTVVPPKVTSSLPSKGSFDITDIVREKPKPIKSYPQPPPPQQHTSSSPGESQDETDRMAVSAQSVTDRLAPPTGKEGEGAAANKTAKPDLPYTKTQWAPFNQEGVKVYERDFLLALRDNPLSREKPPNLPDMIIAGDDRGRLSDGRYSMGGRTDFTNPPFLGYGGKSSSQRGPPPKRNSQSKAGPSGGGGGGGGGGKGSKSQMIKVSISVREDVKLHETENAWKPARFVKSETMTDEDTKTAELYRKVRGVLNKLTPQKFQTLVEKVRALDIDTLDRLQGVIDLVFEKAVDEPNFSVAYALMCRELAMMHVQGDKSDQSPEEQAHASNVNFRKLLITRCQMEFEKNSVDEKARNQRRKEIEQCEDPDKRKEMQEELDEEDRKIRVKSVGNIRFIGELFKQNMLTVNIMLRCLTNLIDAKDEESLECLCKLLTTIGKEMETKNVNLGDIFNTMRDIVERKHGKVSSRVRFMLQDVIDLRKSKWVPRRQESKPKTMEQIQKEAENEHFNIQVMNATPIQQRPRDDRSGSAGPGSDRRRPKNMQDDGGWQTQAPRNNRQQQQFNVQSEKLKFKPIQIDEPLGSSQMFGSWSKGSIMTKTAPSLAPANTANMYAALENIDMDKRPSGKHYSGSMNNNNNKEPYSSKGPSLERGTYKQYNDGRGSRSGSQHRTNSPAPMQQQKMGPPPSSSFGGRDAKFGGGAPSQSGGRSGNVAMAQQAAAPPAEVQATTATAQAEGAAVTALSGEALHRRLENNLDEYLNESCSVAEYDQDTKSCVPAEEMYNVVYEGYMHVLERSSAARIRTGMLFAQVVQKGTIPLADYCKGLKEVLDQADDLIIDIPKIWDYLAEILVHMICEGALPLRSLHKCASKLIGEGHGAHMLASLFRLVVNEKGPNFLANIWQASGLALTDFMRADQTAKFIEEHKLEFLCGGDTPSGQSQLTHEQMEHKLLEFFRQEASFDDVVNWITANVGEKVKEDKFIRCLATAIFKNSIQSNTRLRESTLQSHYNMLHKYVGNKNQELQCLFALQALINKLEHPQGLLLATCERLYDDATFSLESFIAWEENDDPAEQEGKGVALKQLTSFFTQLKENDDEEEEYGSSEADET